MHIFWNIFSVESQNVEFIQSCNFQEYFPPCSANGNCVVMQKPLFSQYINIHISNLLDNKYNMCQIIVVWGDESA